MGAFSAERTLSFVGKQWLKHAGYASAYMLLLPWMSQPLWAEQQEFFHIHSIEFTGNHRTKEQILRQEISIQPGDRVDRASIETARQSIQNLGLFKAVNYRIEHGIVYFDVEEKRYFFLIPEIRQNENDARFTYGGYFYLDNIAGLNQRLKLRYKSSQASQAEHGVDQTYQLRYSYPRVANTAFRFDITMDRKDEPIEIQSSGTAYDRITNSMNLSGSRWLQRHGASRGWQIGGGIELSHRKIKVHRGAQDYTNSDIVSLNLGTNFQNIDNRLFSESGTAFSYGIGVGAPALGSDYAFVLQSVNYRLAMPLKKSHESFQFRASAGVSSNEIYEGPVFSLGGARSMRGYAASSIAGNSFWMLNFEYLTPIFNRDFVRGMLSLDLGNAYADYRDFQFDEVKSSIGCGSYLKFTFFVDLELRLQFAYAVNERESKVYVFVENNF